MFSNWPIINRAYEILSKHFGTAGKFDFSILTVFLSFLIIVVTIWVSRWLRHLLQKRVFPKLEIDPGLEYTLLRLVHYLIVTVGVLYALRIGFDVDMTSVAVVVGFLSLGIGFGLQYIASDLVSGFILLFERPMRIGDRIKVGDVEGRVQSISVRTTIISTNDNLAVIVPNSELVRNRFVNYSYGSPEVRIAVPVGVAYESDVEKVKMALIEAAGAVEDVSSEPAPQVRLKEFAESAIIFEVLVWIKEPHNHQQIKSKVNFEILKAFARHSIEIPSPQQDVRLRSMPAGAEQGGSPLDTGRGGPPLPGFRSPGSGT
jgi:small-conductance mechanosensitive channel